MNDLRFALRQFAQSPAFTGAMLLTLTLGLAINTVLYTITNELFFRPLPAHEPRELAILAQKAPAVDYQIGFSYADVEDLRRFAASGNDSAPDLARVFSGLMAYNEEAVHMGIAGRPTERAWVHAVTNNYFAVLGVQPHLGRFLLPTEGNAPGADPVVVLTHDTWRTRFAGDATIVGKPVQLNGVAFTVVGVAPQGFYGASWGTTLHGFVPATTLTRLLPGGENYALKRGNTRFFLMGRLRPGVAFEEARAACEVAVARVVKDNPGYYLDRTRAVLMKESNSRPSPHVAHYTPKIVTALSALGLLVLLIAGANAANLLHARAVARERELAIRASIGASRFQLMRGLLAESSLLALAAGALGGLASLWLTPALLSLLPQSPSAPPAATGIDWRPFAVTGLASLAVGIAAGLVPAWRTSRTAPLEILKSATPVGRAGRYRLRSLLVVGQVAVSCVVLVGASLALRSLMLLGRLDLGYRTENVLLASFSLGQWKYAPEQGRALHERLLERVRALPGVTAATLGNRAPIDAAIPMEGGYNAADRPTPAGKQPEAVATLFVEPAYLSTLGVRLEHGRDFTARDRFGSPRVVIINRALADQLWPGEDPVGHKIRNGNGAPAEVIGLLGSTRFYSVTDGSRPVLIDLLAQNYRTDATLIVRSPLAPADLAATLTRVVGEIDPELALFNVRSLRDQIRDNPNGLMVYRAGATIAAVQGAVALGLAGTGIFGLIAFAVSRRTREIGIRMALGASRLEVVRMVSRESLVLTAIGLGLGLLASLGLSRLLANLLYRAGAYDSPILTGVALLILLAAALASWVPARRATRVNPIEALRAE